MEVLPGSARSGGDQKSRARIVIIGAGLAGIALAVSLKRAGEHDFVILEKAPGIGGTWFHNSYPGSGVDFPSHLYSYSFGQEWEWESAYAKQGELLRYIHWIAEKYGIVPHLRLGVEVTGCVFLEDSGCWEITSKDGARLLAQYAVPSVGSLHVPNIPKFANMERYAGEAFHSAEWNHAFDYAKKRVAVIGNGSSAAQITPELAKEAASLTVFQRTPNWVLPRPGERRMSGLERTAFRRVPGATQLHRLWLYFGAEKHGAVLAYQQKFLKLVTWNTKLWMKWQIPDPVLREKLTPSYPVGCRRVVASNDYYQALRRLNVEMVTEDIEEFTEAGIRTSDGVERPFDLIVYGTGFKPLAGLLEMGIVGRGGVTLREAWRGGAQAYMTTSVSGFPNLFLMMGPNSTASVQSAVFMIEAQAHYITEILGEMKSRRFPATVEVRPDAQRSFDKRLQQKLSTAVWSTGGCNGYYLDEQGRNVFVWGGSSLGFWRKSRKADMQNYTVSTVAGKGLAQKIS